jgi:simple sugar transport system ATP-binding protein
MSERPAALEMRGITKRFPAVLANDDITFDVRAGEIHALLGENGAGKTTLMNILYGLVSPDAGELRIEGEPVTIRDPSDAIARGIGMVHQHFMLVPVLTVAENVVLGRERLRGPFLDLPAASRRIRELAAQLGFDIDPDARVEQLPVGQQQRVEILKVIYRGARILVLDEPTAVLTPQETMEVFNVLRRLRDGGAAIVFISHKLEEVLAIADRITVIRRGRVVGTRRPRETSDSELATMMVGREVLLRVDRGRSHPGDVVLRVEGLRASDDRAHEVLRGVDLEVRSGEILGVAGVAGNGQDELVEALVGLRAPTAGRVLLGERDITGSPIHQVRDFDVAYVPADRQRFGLVLPFSVEDNLMLTAYDEEPFAVGPLHLLREHRAVEMWAGRLIEEFDIRTPSRHARTATLSGGNQQKVIVAREFRGANRVLILDQPTRGLDVGSIEFIHKRAIQKRDEGVAILLISADLDEVLELSDRVSVMFRGRIVGTFDAADAERDRIGLLMAKGTGAAA